MKKLLCIALCLCMGLGIFASCKNEKVPESKHMLDGKKVIFIGNSHVYVGKTVVDVDKSVKELEPRQNNHGLFYFLCQQQGAEVSVTNWCFSGHGLGSLFGNVCTKSYCQVRHEDYLTDKYYDYVVVNPGVGKEAEANIARDTEYIQNFFTEANPNVKFILLGNASLHGKNSNDTPYPGVTSYYKTLAEKGWIIADWGKIVSDIIDGACTVPDTEFEYKKSSFIIDDGYHPNNLSGYITSMMTYCAITGEKAENMPADFYIKNELWQISAKTQLSQSYAGGELSTNFYKILTSEQDIRQLHKIIDRYLSEKAYTNY